MKQEDLRKFMLGDLVIATVEICDDDWDNEVVHRIPCSIDGISMNGDLGEGWDWTVVPLRKEDAMKYERFDDFEPIPLSAEILEKNGFTEEMDSWWTIDNPRYMSIDIVAYHSIDDDVPNAFLGHWAFNENYAIDYVHELQHALRLCGLNELADGFKIE